MKSRYVVVQKILDAVLWAFLPLPKNLQRFLQLPSKRRALVRFQPSPTDLEAD
jgi:hypothetical protein